MKITQYIENLVSGILETYEKLTASFIQIAKSEEKYLKNKRILLNEINNLKNKNLKNSLNKIINEVSKKLEIDNTVKSVNSKELTNKFNLSGFEIAMITIPENLDIGAKFFEYIKQNLNNENEIKNIISNFKNIEDVNIEHIKKILRNNILQNNEVIELT